MELRKKYRQSFPCRHRNYAIHKASLSKPKNKHKIIHDFMSEVFPQVVLGEESYINMGTNPKGYRAIR